jgi:hypothetical protein
MKRLSIALAAGLAMSTPTVAEEQCNIPDNVLKNLQGSSRPS